MNHLNNHPTLGDGVFRFGTCTYSLTHSYGYWTLRKIVDAKPKPKPEITCKSQEGIFVYLANAERRSPEEAKAAYENII